MSVAVHTEQRGAILASAAALAERMATQASLHPTQAQQQPQVKLEAHSGGGAAAATKRASTEAAAGRGKAEVPALRPTSLHTLTGYLDVGDDALFRNDKAWLLPACEKLVVAPPPPPTATVSESVTVKAESKQ